MQHTEFGTWFVFTTVTLAQGTDPNPARLLAFLGISEVYELSY